MNARSVVIIVIAAAMMISVIPVWSVVNNLSDHSSNATFTPYNPYSAGGTWYKGQLHVHSTRSDGDLSPSGVASRYDSMGYDFIAITDHHTVTKIKGTGILVLGQESGKGSVESGEMYKPHMNGIGVSSVYDESASLQKRIDSFVSQNGIVVLNHPTTIMFSYSKGDLIGLTNYTAMEIYNGYGEGILGGDPVGMWDEVLSSGKRVWGVAADDAHQADNFGRGWIEVRTSEKLSTTSVLNAIKKGSFYSTQGPEIQDIKYNGTTLTIIAPGADSISFIGRDGKQLSSVDSSNATYTLNGNEGYVRAEVHQDGKTAWTQPVFVETRSSNPEATNNVNMVESVVRRVDDPAFMVQA